MNRRLGAALCLAWVRLTPVCIVQVTLLETFLTRRIVVLRSESRGSPSARPHRAVVDIEICFNNILLYGAIYYVGESCMPPTYWLIFSKAPKHSPILIAGGTCKTDAYSSSKTAKGCRYVLDTIFQILICDHPRFLCHVEDDNVFDQEGVDIENGKSLERLPLSEQTGMCNLPVALFLPGIRSLA